MSQIFLQQDPKTSVGDNDDAPTSIPTPEQLGSFLFTHVAGTLGKVYCAVLVAGVPTWVLCGTGSAAGIPLGLFSGRLDGSAGLAQGYMANTGNVVMPTTNSRYPAGPVGFTARQLTVRVPTGENSMDSATTVVVLLNGNVTGLSLSITTATDGEFTSPEFPITYAPGDYLDILVSSQAGGVGKFIRLSAILTV